MPPQAPSRTGRRTPLWAAVFALLATLLGSLVTAAPPAAAAPVLCDQYASTTVQQGRSTAAAAPCAPRPCPPSAQPPPA
ncbi:MULTISPECIES: hypothetical protein [unclassified Streptomyces]|uniref:hypothetical protein n=1 Tax=unclassified Streptomyces TaxID=2593676 RepID=UPI00380E1844